MSQFHLHANPGDVAPLVLLPGDPNRATYIAETFFDAPKCYTSNRQLLGYTGTYQGMPISVQTTGMGCPSLAIVVEELVNLGAKTLIRVGTSGIIESAVKPGELIIATAATPSDGTTNMYLGGQAYAPVPSFEVTRALVEAAGAQGVTHHTGLIRTEDAFYATTPDDVENLAKVGVLGVEMESSALFLLGKMRRVEAATVLVASNYIGDPQVVAPDIMTRGIESMVGVALAAGLALKEKA